ncbi:glycoside hydrolase family 31 protein [Tessaracoccus sp. G1721]
MMFDAGARSLLWRGGGETLLVEAWGDGAVRVRSAVGEVADADWALLAPSPGVAAEVTVDGDTATLTTGGITVVARQSGGLDWQAGQARFDCRLEFRDATGRLLFREIGPGGALKLDARRFEPLPGGGYRATLTLEAPADERLWGMGQYQDGVGDLKGSTLELAHRNSQASVPFVLSSAGYGFLWHCPAIGRATFAANRTEWVAESATQLDYWVVAGDTPAEIHRRYADATGHAPMMPELGLGFWQCKLRYATQDELLEVAREHKRRGLPLDVIVADFFHWPKMGDYRFDEEFWPDPAAMTAELRELGVELMVSVWPQVSLDSENFDELAERGLLARSNAGIDVQMWFQGPSRFLDVTNPRGREWLWETCRRNYADRGVRLYWLDEAEPEWGLYQPSAYRFHAGQALAVGNIYPQAFSRAFAEGQAADGVDGVVNLVRCAWAGSQRFGALVWSGDIASTWESLRAQITAGIHIGVAGIPWFTTDIGGFYGGHVDDPAFHELLVRWFQFGTFLPVMRLHGDRAPGVPVTGADGVSRQPSGAPNEVWSYGEEVYGILREHLFLREALRDYTRSAMAEAHRDGQPVMRGVFHGFPDDPVAWTVTDQFLFGPDLLVAPVVEPGARSRPVYLPAGASWTSLATGERLDGGAWADVVAPLHVIPVFARDDACGHLVAPRA